MRVGVTVTDFYYIQTDSDSHSAESSVVTNTLTAVTHFLTTYYQITEFLDDVIFGKLAF